jgi:alpha-tubulin suppressor-like RCC1 family protein
MEWVGYGVMVPVCVDNKFTLTTHNTQHTTHNTQHTTHNTQHTTHNTLIHFYTSTHARTVHLTGTQGQLGLGSQVDRFTPTLVPLGDAALPTTTTTTTTTTNPTHVVSIEAGNKNAIALLSDGLVYAWGSGIADGDGLGQLVDRYTPALLPIMSHLSVTQVVSNDNCRGYMVAPKGCVSIS